MTIPVEKWKLNKLIKNKRNSPFSKLRFFLFDFSLCWKHSITIFNSSIIEKMNEFENEFLLNQLNEWSQIILDYSCCCSKRFTASQRILKESQIGDLFDGGWWDSPGGCRWMSVDLGRGGMAPEWPTWATFNWHRRRRRHWKVLTALQVLHKSRFNRPLLQDLIIEFWRR